MATTSAAPGTGELSLRRKRNTSDSAHIAVLIPYR